MASKKSEPSKKAAAPEVAALPIRDIHVDDFIDSPLSSDEGEVYARWFFMLHRLPAILQLQFDKYIKPFKLFCTFDKRRYRVTGASRLGDVWLTKNFTRDNGYELRVNVTECSQWGARWYDE
jgi:hypothetical protein